VRSTARAEFKAMVAAGEVDETTHVFDTTVSTARALNTGRFEVPLSESWHGTLFLGARVRTD